MQKYDKYDIEGDLSSSYRCMVNHLRKKYGPVPYDYFVNESCKTVNSKNSRTSEGLVIHHVDEDKAIMLSERSYAVNSPFKYQKANRLVYCNLLEHLILHYLIFENTGTSFGLGGAINHMVPAINDYYNGLKPKQEYQKKIYSVLDDNFEGYISVLIEIEGEAFMYPWAYKRASKENLSKGTDGKIVDKIYKELSKPVL